MKSKVLIKSKSAGISYLRTEVIGMHETKRNRHETKGIGTRLKIRIKIKATVALALITQVRISKH